MTNSISLATVKFTAWKVISTSRGDKVNIVATLENGIDIRIWGNLNDPITELKKGQIIEVSQKKDGSYCFIKPHSS